MSFRPCLPWWYGCWSGFNSGVACSVNVLVDEEELSSSKHSLAGLMSTGDDNEIKEVNIQLASNDGETKDVNIQLASNAPIY